MTETKNAEEIPRGSLERKKGVLQQVLNWIKQKVFNPIKNNKEVIEVFTAVLMLIVTIFLVRVSCQQRDIMSNQNDILSNQTDLLNIQTNISKEQMKISESQEDIAKMNLELIKPNIRCWWNLTDSQKIQIWIFNYGQLPGEVSNWSICSGSKHYFDTRPGNFGPYLWCDYESTDSSPANIIRGGEGITLENIDPKNTTVRLVKIVVRNSVAEIIEIDCNKTTTQQDVKYSAIH